MAMMMPGHDNGKPAAPQTIPATASAESSGLKIRIPRSTPNLPEAFRKRGAIRSQSEMSTGNGPSSIKRTQDCILDSDGHSTSSSLSPAPASSAISPAVSIAATSEAQSAASTAVQKQRTKSKSKSNSPTSTPARFPSPAHPSGETASVVTSPELSQASESSKGAPAPLSAAMHSHGTRSADGIAQAATVSSGSAVATVGPTGSNSPSGSMMSVTPVSQSADPDMLQPIELVRVGMGILDRLLCNTFSKSFINKVPQSVTNYHVVIKKPMDLTTIEQKLWKTLELASKSRRTGSSSSAPGSLLKAAAEFMAMGVTEGYATLNDVDRDLRRIVQNALYFNSPTHVIYKEAEDFQKLQTKILTSYRQGPLYIFRAHTLREMDRKMTDISTDLFATFHQPIFDITTEQIGRLSPTQPRFVRMYINKNRSVLAKCRDEQFARIAILSDVQVGKPYSVPNPATTPGPSDSASGGPGRTKSGGTGANGASISMVRMTAKVLIGKPIGERHDMVTVGDLDCPNAWITVACVRALEIDLEIPSKFDKGVLSKMRHEVMPYSSDNKVGSEHQKAFADALGLELPGAGKGVQAHGSIGQRSAIPAANSTPPLPPSTQSSTPTPIPAAIASSVVSISFPKIHSVSSASSSAIPESKSDSSRSQKTSVNTSWVDLHDQGPTGRYMVKLRIPAHLFKGIHRPAAASENSHVSGTSTASQRIVVSMPSTPTLPSRVHPLSSQVPAVVASPSSEQETLSAPDRMMLNEQITKRGDKILKDLKVAAKKKNVPYARWSDIEPTLTVDTAHGLFKRIYHVRGQDGLVIQNFKEMDAESFGQRVREVACLLKLRGVDGVGQIQSVIENEEDHLVGLSMTKYAYTLKQYATNARRHPTPCQKLSLVRDMVSAMCAIHNAGLAHRDLSEVNIMVDEDVKDRLEDHSPRPHVKVIDFGKSVFVSRDEVRRWSMEEKVSEDELSLLPLVVLPPDHGYKLYRSILTLPKNKQDHTPLPPLDPRAEDVYSLGVLIWRTFSGKSPWDGTIEDDLKTIRYLVSTDAQIRFQLEREVVGPVSRELLLHCLTAQAETRWTTQQLKDWLDQPEIANELLKEFEALGGGRKKVRKNLD
ncbi:Receptor-interacting serine/threonine-protein kinase 1 [Mortierella sp. GBA30]|nr:Receptor-interacting serine/threonine-protein kinase 1 [Mortierella sp. GBA30]